MCALLRRRWWGQCGRGTRCHLCPRCRCSSTPIEVGRIDWRGTESYGGLDHGDVLLDSLDILGGALDLLEHLVERGLLQHLANEREGGCEVWLNDLPRDLIGSALIYGLQVVAYFSKVCGMLIDVFGAHVYQWPSRRHYHEKTRFRRVNRDNGLR